MYVVSLYNIGKPYLLSWIWDLIHKQHSNTIFYLDAKRGIVILNVNFPYPCNQTWVPLIWTKPFDIRLYVSPW